MKELGEMTQTAFEAMAADGKLMAMVRTQVEACVKQAVSECTGYGSEFSKSLKAHVAATLPMDFSGLGLAGYNAEIMKVMKEKFEACRAKWVEKSIAEEMEEMLKFPPAEMKLSELVALLRKDLRADDKHQKLTVDVDEVDSAGWWAVKLKLGLYDEYRLAVTKQGEVYSISLPYQGDVTKKLFAARSGGLDRALWCVYAAKTRLVRDAVDVWEEDD